MSQRDHMSVGRPFQSARADDGLRGGSRPQREFGDEVRSERRRERTRDVVNAGTGIVAAVVGGPVGAMVRAVQSRIGGAEEGASGAGLDSMWQMQDDSREFTREYLSLQQQMQTDNQQFQAISNLMKARHDTARAAISNMRV